MESQFGMGVDDRTTLPDDKWKTMRIRQGERKKKLEELSQEAKVLLVFALSLRVEQLDVTKPRTNVAVHHNGNGESTEWRAVSAGSLQNRCRMAILIMTIDLEDSQRIWCLF